MQNILFTFATVALLFSVSVQHKVFAAQQTDSLYTASTEFDPKITTPKDFLGHELGQKMVQNNMMTAYFRQLAAQSERVNYEVIGYSHENRPIVTLTITSPKNMANLPQIQANHMAMQTADKKSTISADMPVISWINFGVHGGEVSSTDSAMPVAYHLAAAQGQEIDSLLENSVILLTASFNPDGNTRESTWNWQYSSNVVITDPNHALHGSPWPSGRTNHYWFDLNRQWMLQQQPEPVSWVKKFHQWRPNIVADFHEMRSYKTFYFHPGAPDRVHPLIDDQAMELLNEVVQGPRDFMDSEAKLYFNQESYDNFYLGKGATYPHLFGSLGILFEQASSAGILETPRGLLSFRENIRTYYHVAIALLENAAEKRQALLSFQQDFVRNSEKMADRDDIKAYIYSAPEDPVRLFHFNQLLTRNKIQIKPLAKDFEVNGKTFRKGEAFIVESEQENYRMLKGVFSKITTFENNTFYDVSGWTLPLAFGIDFEPLTRTRYKADSAITVEFPSQQPPSKATVAYGFDWSHYNGPKVLYELLEQGYLPRIATKPFTAQTDSGSQSFGRGSVIVPVNNKISGYSNANSDNLYKIMQQAAIQDGVKIHALNSSHTSSIGMDLGSNSLDAVSLPKVALVIGAGMSPYQAGEVWHLLDKRMQIPVTLIEKQRLSNVDLSAYTHLVMTNGKYSDISDSLQNKITTWVRNGGALVGIGDGARWAGLNLLNLTLADIGKGKLASQPRIDYADKSMVKAQDIIGGAVMAGDLDISHPLGYGYTRREIASQRSGLLAFEPPQNPYASVVKITPDSLLSGYASAENQQKLAGKTSLVAERKGKGSVILFTDDPNFRGYFYGTEKLFLNSLFFSTLFSAP
ncbi:MAG: M14 family zinc carboxypeptidase [Aliiglaciecola sp.]|uniref:M14 family zinc carboxypeptidase n=1 Tax=Aliiglaciecola sp. TaxID=1872441 RepID=UPI00329947FA